MTQSEAVRLADILKKMPLGACDEQAADELLRLHAENDRLRSENAALQADAARYQWLRHGDNDELVLSRSA